MSTEKFEVRQDWDNDGMLVYKNAKTLNRYQELCRERDETDVSKFRCFSTSSTITKASYLGMGIWGRYRSSLIFGVLMWQRPSKDGLYVIR